VWNPHLHELLYRDLGRGTLLRSDPPIPSWIDVVGIDIAIVGERHLADGALPVLFNYFSIEQFPHFRFGAKLSVSSADGAGLRYVALRAFRLPFPSEPARGRSKRAIDEWDSTDCGGVSWISSRMGFQAKRQVFDFLCAYKPIAPLSTPKPSRCALVNWRMCAAW
jgi:hypothetical protein